MTCMNAFCGSSTSAEWRKGWPLRSGGFANLCDKCGSAYEQSIFCDLFHTKDSGWRECVSCGKRVHCGCVGSVVFIELLDSGGVNCRSCSKKSGLSAMNEEIKPNGFVMPPIDHACQLHATSSDRQLSTGSLENRKFMQLSNNAEIIGLRHLTQLQNGDLGASFVPVKQEEVLRPARELETACFSGFNQTNGLPQSVKPDICKENIYESLMQTNLSISLGGSLSTPSSFPGSFVEEKGKISAVMQQASKSRQLLPRPPKSALEGNAGLSPQIRVARPPAEGRGRNQLLPRYWPRITDQELQQISGDSNSTIVPLFEKVLSASDAGRIGRLVLPKACAEAYFPPISQPEGLPLRIQDVRGKEWVFQFRFWPNNNSRMYVLEGVTPCIQSMQLQAGDTVTFSRMDPEGKLVMGFRKATNAITIQETQPSAFPNGNLSSESFFSGVFEKLPIISGYSGLLQSLKGSSDPHLNPLSKHLNSARADISWCSPDKHDDRKEGLLVGSSVNSERKRTRNIGSKSKRLIMDNFDALELKLTWEEAQDMLRPPPSVKPSIVKIEDHDFEEYEEPPVFGKRSIFVVRLTGEQEQWVQCESCSKWRKLPVDTLLPPNWTCAENTWDQSRSSCSSPDELTPKDLENLLRQNKEFKRRKMIAYEKSIQEQESSGLDALASAAMVGDKDDNPETTSVAATTRHPRHRPGCSCIVCIQPPSGKGKHKPTCTCIVCMTVKRRFKTLMMRKKKRQSESEAEAANRNHQMCGPREEAEVDSICKPSSSHPDPSENESKLGTELESKSPSNNPSNNVADTSKGDIDLNSNPEQREDNSVTAAGLDRVSMVNLLQVATLPLETYLKESGLPSLGSEQQQQQQQASMLSDVQPSEAENQEQPDDDDDDDDDNQSPSEEQQQSVDHENRDAEMDTIPVYGT